MRWKKVNEVKTVQRRGKCEHKGEYRAQTWVEIKCNKCGVIVEKVTYARFIKREKGYAVGE